MSRWADFYRVRMNEEYRRHVASRYAPFIQKVCEAAAVKTTAIEMGCGAGNVSREVVARLPGTHVMLTDKDHEVLKLCKENVSSLGQDNWMVIQNDFLEEPMQSRFGLVYAHGVLEHFGDDQIRQIIAHQTSIAPRVLHYVPSAMYLTPSFGDERLLTSADWIRICRPDKITPFNDGYDYILEWNRG